MNTLLLLFTLIAISSHTYISYITFLLCMVHLVLYILLLGHSYLSILYLIIYIGSIAILFIYILMVLSAIAPNNFASQILFILPFFALQWSFDFLQNQYILPVNIIQITYNLYSSLLIPIAILLLLAMIFAIRYI